MGFAGLGAIFGIPNSTLWNIIRGNPVKWPFTVTLIHLTVRTFGGNVEVM